jgi:hypothetical protein
MKPVLTKKAHKELTDILQKQFKGNYSEELIEDLGVTFLNLAVIALKRKIRLKKELIRK